MKQLIVRDKDSLIILRTCSVSKKIYSVIVNYEDYLIWKKNALIQDAMPYLSIEQREFIKSNITPMEWDRIFEIFQED